VQEIVHANEPFGRGAEEDSTGLGLWSASLVLARWLADNKHRLGLRGAHVVELGAGCGLPGLAAAVHAQPRRVTLTDLNPAALKNLR
jgi:predicted nicotinamide N-methyase